MKRLLIPVAVLLIILVVWLIQSKMETKRITGKTIENFLNLQTDDIDKMIVRGVTDTLSFIRDKGNWYLAETTPRLCDSMAIASVLEAATGLKVGNIISQNAQRQSEFMVDSLGGALVQFFRADQLLGEIIIGKIATNRTHTYIREPNSDDVYLAEGMLSYLFVRQRTQWLDKSILSLNRDFLTSIELVYPDNSFKVTLHDSIYYVSKKPYKDSLIADSNKAKVYFYRISEMTASDFMNVTDSGMVDFDNFSLILNVTQYDGVVHTVEFARVDPENSRIFCRKPGYDEVYVIYQSRFGNLKEKFAAFLP